MTDLTIPDEAVEAAGLALHLDACTDDEHDTCDVGDWDREARLAIAAALPYLLPTLPARWMTHYRSHPSEVGHAMDREIRMAALQVPESPADGPAPTSEGPGSEGLQTGKESQPGGKERP